MWQRWNQTTHIFEKSDDDGGLWVPLPLSGSVITEGTVADARLSSNVPLKNASNVFSAIQKIQMTRPSIEFGTGAIARVLGLTTNQVMLAQNLNYDGTNFNIDDTTKSGWSVRVVNSAEGDTVDFLRASAGANPRTPTVPFRVDSSGKIYERVRAATPEALGEYTAYTASWTATTSNPALGNGVKVAHYARAGNMCSYMIQIVPGTTTTFGTGIYKFGLPFNRGNSAYQGIHYAYIVDGGVTTYLGLGSFISESEVVFQTTHDRAFWTNAAPFTFANTDVVYIAGHYWSA